MRGFSTAPQSPVFLSHFDYWTIGSLFRWPSDGERADSSAEELFELAGEAVGSQRSSGVRIDWEASEVSLVDPCI